VLRKCASAFWWRRAEPQVTTPGTFDVRKLLVRMIDRRSGDEEHGGAIAAARQAYDDLAVVLVPLVSQAGFDALIARALQLARREYPAEEWPANEAGETEQFAEVRFWLDHLNPRRSNDGAAAMFAELAAMLNTMIGESLTTRYLRKAWPDGFSAARAKRDK
jgi:hypothetical protein